LLKSTNRLKSLKSAQFTLEMRVAARNRDKIY